MVAGRALVAFGGAAPIHAARLAGKLGITRIVVPAAAGVGSAVGFLRAAAAYEVVRSRYMRLGEFDAAVVDRIFEALEQEARAVVEAAAPEGALTQIRTAHMRYVGQGHEIVAELPVRRLGPADHAVLQAAFEETYGRFYGRLIPGLDIEVLSWGLRLTGPTAPIEPQREPGERRAARPRDRRVLFDPDTAGSVEVPVFWRPDLPVGGALDGPAVIAEEDTTILVPAGWGARVDARRHVWLERAGGASE
jgi:N-methylhydantoinase A